mgnify:CR=1 FL=1
MFITVGINEYELSTKLSVAVALEKKFKKPLVEILSKIGQADIPEMISMLQISVGKTNDIDFANEIQDNWDYTELSMAAQGLLANLMFGGTPEQQAEKIDKAEMHSAVKNQLRKLLNLPTAVSEGTSGATKN